MICEFSFSIINMPITKCFKKYYSTLLAYTSTKSLSFKALTFLSSVLFSQNSKSIAAVCSPNSCSQLQHFASLQARQHGEDLWQLMLSQFFGTRIQHHLLHCSSLRVLLPKLCHIATNYQAHKRTHGVGKKLHMYVSGCVYGH